MQTQVGSVQIRMKMKFFMGFVWKLESMEEHLPNMWLLGDVALLHLHLYYYLFFLVSLFRLFLSFFSSIYIYMDAFLSFGIVIKDRAEETSFILL
jgi:hypothetical protein